MSRLEFTKPTMREALKRAEGLCEGVLPTGERCCFPVDRKKHFDHIVPAALGGDNSLQNCAVLCIPCHDAKTRFNNALTGGLLGGAVGAPQD